MKKFFSGFIKGLILSIVGIVAFMWVFSVLFPRAYYVIEGKVLGIENDSIVTVAKAPITPKTDSTKVFKGFKQVQEFKYAVKLEQDGNCYYVGTKVNGIPMKMLLDTGASNLVLSIVEYEFLRKQGLLKDTSAQLTNAVIADGRNVKCYQIKIEEIAIGKKTIKNVDCTVMEQQDAPILLGMNVLKEFGDISIDYKRHLLILER